MLDFFYPEVKKAFLLQQDLDVFLLPQMYTDKITVIELDLTNAFEMRFDSTLDRWTDTDNLPIGIPIFELMSPVHGELKLLALNKNSVDKESPGIAIMVIVDTIIVLEYQQNVLDYKLATGFENGRIVKYFTEHQPD